MNGSMRCGRGHPMGSGGGGYQMGIPLIPAPAALCALLVGVMIGVLIGRKKSMMHGMGPGMMHGMGPGMGPGMMRGMGPGTECGGGAWGDWAARKKMMGKMSGHHHHGEGMPACKCDQGPSDAAAPTSEE